MRVFCATLSHETNRFSPVPTNIDSYREFYLYLPSSGEGAHYLEAGMEGVNLARHLKRSGHEVICGLAASAQPSMPTNLRDYEFLRNELLTNLERALPVDAVMLLMHGAQMAQAYDDCEGDVLSRIRTLVGPDVPIGLEFDLHGNVTQTMVEAADILLPCKEYPHIDFEDRCEQLMQLLQRTVSGEIQPQTLHLRIPMLGTYFTTRQPMRDYVDSLTMLEGHDGILAVNLCHGFAWSDIPAAGACMLVVHDRKPRRAQQIAEDCSERLFRLRHKISTPLKPTAAALDEAELCRAHPVIIADMPDNPGGGAAGDSTWLLEAMLARGMSDAALAMIHDPVAVQIAKSAGIGARLPLRIGGKSGPASGRPLDVDAVVTALNDEASQMAQGMRVPLGPAAAIRVGGVEIVLNSVRNQTFAPECFSALGIDPRRKKYLVVKSHQHFHEHFAEFAGHIIYATPPGTVTMDYRNASLTHITRPLWPIDRPPFEAFGRTWGNRGQEILP